MTEVRAPRAAAGTPPPGPKPFGFTIMNRVVNPFLGLVLRSPAHRVLSGWTAELEYTGRRSGRPRRVVVMYATHDDSLVIGVGSAEGKTWWRNFTGSPAPVTVRLAGRVRTGTAVVVTDPDRAAMLGARYRARFPRTSRATGGEMVVVEVALAADPAARAPDGENRDDAATSRRSPPPVDDPAHAHGHRHLPPPRRQVPPVTSGPGAPRHQPWVRRSHSDSGQRRYRRGR